MDREEVQKEDEIVPEQASSSDPAASEGPNTDTSKPKRLLCTVENCQFSTPRSKDLGRHMRKHTGEKPFKCHLCPKSYSRIDKLSIHVKVHLNQKTFKCESCPYSAVDSWSLRKHLRVHSDERPYKCQLCPYAAKESSQLVAHVRTHTGDHPFSCLIDWCDAVFKTRSDLVRHSRIHSKEKPYACPHCTYKAAVKCNLNLHLRKAHQELGTGKSGDLPKQAIIEGGQETNTKIISSSDELSQKPGHDASNMEPNILNPVDGKCHPATGLPVPNSEEDSCPSKVSVIKKNRAVGRPRCSGKSRHPPAFDCSFCKASFVCKSSLKCHLRQHSASSTGIPDTSNKSSPPSSPPLQLGSTAPPQSHYLNFLNATSSSGGGDGLFTSSYPNLNFNSSNT